MMTLAHIIGGGSTDEWVASALVLSGLVWLLRRSERRARRRRQEMEDRTAGVESDPQPPSPGSSR